MDDEAVTLTDEHALLLDRVAALVADVLTVAMEDRWPHREMRALLGYLHAEVLRQVGDEERLLFPGGATPPGLDRLRRDHLRLRHCAEALAGAAGGGSGWSVARVATTSRDLLTMLERHLATEDALLRSAYAHGPVPATAALTSRGTTARRPAGTAGR